MKASLGLAVVATVVTVVALDLPPVRASIQPQRRVDWEDHVRDLQARGRFRRYYRMNVASFRKLADLLRPKLERDDAFARECD